LVHPCGIADPTKSRSRNLPIPPVFTNINFTVVHPSKITRELKAKANELGFQLTGACPAVKPTGLHRFFDWLDQGYAGTMHYLPERRNAYSHPKHVLENTRSLLVLGMHYGTGTPQNIQPGEGKIASYAWGTTDYHDLIHQRLKQLRQFHQQLLPEQQCRGVVDTAPILEKDFAQKAGVGWIGKNTLLINRTQGSYFFLAVLLTTAELEYDAAIEREHCGGCTACLDACPTDAFPRPFVLDARRCISYLTIEHRDCIDDDLKQGLQDWSFGCDICQDVCPWNHRGSLSEEPAFAAIDQHNRLNLSSLFEMDEEQFRRTFRKTPMWRAKRDGLMRNAAIVLGNQRSIEHLDLLKRAANDTKSTMVRDACIWAIEQIESR